MTGCGQRGAGSVRDVRTGGGSSEHGCGERPARAGAGGFRRPAWLLLLALAALAIVDTPQARAQTDIWSATLTVGSAYGSLGYADGAGGSLSPTNSFRLGSTNYRVETVLTLSSGLSFATQPSLSAEVASDLALNVGSTVGARSLRFADASFSFGTYRWSFSPALGWAVGDTVPMSIAQASSGPPDTEPPVTVPDREDRRGLQTRTNWFDAPSAGTNLTSSEVADITNPDETVTILGKDVAQSFTTGRCEGGYELKSVMVRFRSGGWRYPLRLTLHEAVGETPGDKIADFRNPGMGTFRQTVSVQDPAIFDIEKPESYALQRRHRIYAGFLPQRQFTTTPQNGTTTPRDTTPRDTTPRNATILEPDTTYFLALHSTVTTSLDKTATGTPRYWAGGTDAPRVSLTSSDSEAETLNNTEWSIGNRSVERNRSTAEISDTSSSRALWSSSNNSVMLFIGFNAKEPACRDRRNTPLRIGPKAQEVEVPADWAGIPDGLGAGDRFRLVFVTKEKRGPGSTNISDYDTFVRTSAGASGAWEPMKAYKANFRVLGTTAAVDARDHTGTNPERYTGVPVYWINGGGKIANDNADFYDGRWTGTFKNVTFGNITESVYHGVLSDGSLHPFDRANGSDYVYTGSYYYGTKAEFPLGHAGGSAYAAPSNANALGPSPGAAGNSKADLQFYGLSLIFRVAGGAEQANALPQLSVTNAAALESGDGSTTTMTFAVGLDPSPGQPMSVRYATEDGTATGGSACAATPAENGPDFVAAGGSLKFEAGDTSKQVEVTVCDDTVEDSGEEFRLKVWSSHLAPEDGEAPVVYGTGLIANLETTTEVSIAPDAAYAEEGTEAVFTLTRAGEADEALTVPVSVTAQGAVLGSEVPASVSFAARARVAELRVPTDDDEADEPDATVTATVAAGFGWRLAEGGASAAMTVLDNDAAPAREPEGATIWLADMQVVDYENGTIGAANADLFSNVRGELDLEPKWLWYYAPGRTLRLAFTTGVPDVEGMTLQVGDVVLAFPEGSAGNQGFTWTDVDKPGWKDGETVTAQLVKRSESAVSNDATLGALSVSGAGLSPAFDAGAMVYTAAVDAHTVTVTARPSHAAATVAFAPAQDADAEREGHQVAVGPGETVLVAVTVTAEDLVTQRDYRVVVSRGRAPVAVSFGAAAYTATEDGEAAAVTVSLAAEPEGTVTVPLVATPEGGAVAADFEAPLEVTFERGGALTRTVTVQALEDDSAEDGERVVLGFGTLPEGLVAGDPSSTAVTLADPPANAPPTGLPVISGTAEVGGTLTVSAERIADADGLTGASFAWQWLADDGSGAAGIEGATAPAYTVGVADKGKTFAVRVTFSDDREEEHTLVSAATEPVPVVLTAVFEGVPGEHDGSSIFTFRVRFDPEPRVSYKVLRDESFDVTGATVRRARRVNGSHSLREIHIQPSGHGDVVVTLRGGRACGTHGAICTADAMVLWNTVTKTIRGRPALGVADAQAEEGRDATIDFVVSLSRAASGPATVDYATADGTAKAGEDYTESSGTLTFAAGETEKTVAVPVLDDAKDEGEETFTLTLSNPSGALIGDGEATGTISNTDPMPKAWLARFGRTVAGQVVDAVTSRLEGGGGSHVTVGGQTLSLDGTGAGMPLGIGAGQGDGEEAHGLSALAGRIADTQRGSAWQRGGWPDENQSEGYTMTGRELLLGSSFHLASDGRESGGAAVAAWGRVTVGGFEADVDDVRMDGDVTTGIVGADISRDRWLAGAAVSLSEGEGGYRLAGGMESAFDRGTVESTLTSVYPYGQLRLNDRVSVWGLAGYGTGELTLSEENGTRTNRYRTDLSMRLGALGVRGTVVEAPPEGGLEVAVKSDAFWVRTSSDAVEGMSGAEADASRVRLLLDASRSFEMDDGAWLTPSLELGLRHDGGDAETGTGVEVGAGIRYEGAGVAVEASVRGLVAHEEAGYEEWGASGSVRIDPDASGRGLSLILTPVWGAAAGSPERLWSLPDARGLAGDAEFEAESRLDAVVGYGFPVLGGRGVATPHAGWSRSGESETWQLGQRLRLGRASEWRVAAEFADESRTYRAGYGYRLTDALDLSVEASRREGASDDGAEHGIGLRAGIRW